MATFSKPVQTLAARLDQYTLFILPRPKDGGGTPVDFNLSSFTFAVTDPATGMGTYTVDTLTAADMSADEIQLRVKCTAAPDSPTRRIQATISATATDSTAYSTGAFDMVADVGTLPEYDTTRAVPAATLKVWTGAEDSVVYVPVKNYPTGPVGTAQVLSAAGDWQVQSVAVSTSGSPAVQWVGVTVRKSAAVSGGIGQMLVLLLPPNKPPVQPPPIDVEFLDSPLGRNASGPIGGP